MSVATTTTSSQSEASRADLDARPARTRAALAVARVLLGWIFMWAFLDKTFGLGVETPPEESWLAGISPTQGYLASLDGTFAGLFHALAGQVWVDWAFMLGMLSVGTALTLGVALRPAAVAAVALMGSLWLTSIPVENNPVVDEHVIYAALAVVLAATRAGDAFGAGRMWSALPVVRRRPWLT